MCNQVTVPNQNVDDVSGQVENVSVAHPDYGSGTVPARDTTTSFLRIKSG